MTKLEQSVQTVLEQQKTLLATSTYESRRRYFNQLLKLATQLGIDSPCQELYDEFTARANSSVDLCFQLNHCVKLIDAVAQTRGIRRDGILYNEPLLPSDVEVENGLEGMSYPVVTVDIGFLIVKAKKEMEYLHLTKSTSGQYLHAWKDLYRYFYIQRITEYRKSIIQEFINEITIKRDSGQMKVWKWKINRRAALILIKVAETGHFQWRPFLQKTCCCFDESLEGIRLQYISYLEKKNLSKATIDLHDYVFRTTLELAGFRSTKELQSCAPTQIQTVLHGFSTRCNQRSIATIFPIVRQILDYLFTINKTNFNLSGMVMGAFVQRGNVASYITLSDESKLILQLEKTSLRTKAIVLLALRLGLRDSDICQLTFGAIDWKEDKIRLIQKKTSEPLVLPLLPDVGNALMDYILNERPKRNDNYPYIFLRKQAPYNQLVSAYMSCSKIIEQAEIKPVGGKTTGLHLFRYTLVHRLLAAKVPHQVITDTLGHVSKESDKPYLSMEESMLRMCALDLSVIGRKSWKEGEQNG